MERKEIDYNKFPNIPFRWTFISGLSASQYPPAVFCKLYSYQNKYLFEDEQKLIHCIWNEYREKQIGITSGQSESAE